MSKRKRNDLTLADRYEVVKLLDQRLTQTEISKSCDVQSLRSVASTPRNMTYVPSMSKTQPLTGHARDPVKPATWKQHSGRGLSTTEPDLYLVQY
jgi:hypothetical protein